VIERAICGSSINLAFAASNAARRTAQ